MKKVCGVLLLMALLLPAGLKGEEAPADSPAADEVLLGQQIRWTPAPAEEEAAAESWIPDEEQLAAAYPAETLEAAGVGERILRRGMQGADVSLVQKRLIELGYLRDEADGRYGRQTESAVTLFQQENALQKVDGKAGTETLRRLFSDGAAWAPSAPPETAEATDAPTPAPTPAPSATPMPDPASMPFQADAETVYLGETPVTLLVGRRDGVKYYPLLCAAAHLGYTCSADGEAYAIEKQGEARVVILASGQEGASDYVMGFRGDLLFTLEETVLSGEGELWAGAAFLRALGFHVVETGDTTVIW